ncbi:MAG: hydrogenase maturation protease [Armatimonadota bacterium]|nr:hydrogenase maturation protease [Armatimonadota bacterium]
MRRAPLVIAWGNPLRGDDGAGPAVARAVAARGSATVRICHQLTPELAADVAAASRVVFVDARAGPAGRTGASARGVRVRRLRGQHTPPAAFNHAMAPETLLILARTLYGTAPPAFLVTVRGARFALGSGLSPSVRRLIPAAARVVLRLLPPRPAS